MTSLLPYPSRYVDVLEQAMHYVDAGSGDPILFVHGEPTWLFLWRNVMPRLEGLGRVIAVDNIGFGLSAKPAIDYTYADHMAHLDGFIQAMDLRNITIVCHDWGSALAFDYASRHPSNVAGVALMEAMIEPAYPIRTIDRNLPELNASFPIIARDPERGPKLLLHENAFIETYLPKLIKRKLTDEEWNAYRMPFPTPESRVPILRWPQQVPIDGDPHDVSVAMDRYNAWLRETDIPRLHLYAEPGSINTPEMAIGLARECRNYTAKTIGEGLHYVQEDQPERIGDAIAHWIASDLRSRR